MASELSNLYAQDYEHRLDRTALENMLRTPGIDKIVRKFNDLGIEKLLRTINDNSHLEITAESFPEIQKMLEEVCETINLPFIPKIHIERTELLDAMTIGADDPIIMLSSEAIERFTAEELRFIIGREVGHIKSDHILYHQIGKLMPYISKAVGMMTLGISNLITPVAEIALQQWSMMADLTADRAGLLAVQDLEIATKTMAKFSGLPATHYDKYEIKHFIKQARSTDTIEKRLGDKLIKFASTVITNTSWSVSRMGELLRWIDTGNYDRVIKKSIPGPLLTAQCTNCRHIMRGNILVCTKCGHPTVVEAL